MISLSMWNLKKIIQMDLFTEQKQTERLLFSIENKLIETKGEREEEDKLGV